MNRLFGLIGTVVLAAALLGAIIGWNGFRFPFQAQNRSSNQLDTAQQTTSAQPANRQQSLRANQPTRTTAQAPADTTANPDTSGNANAQTEQQPSDQAVPALW